MSPYNEMTDNPQATWGYLILWLKMTNSHEPISQEIKVMAASIHSEYPVEQTNLKEHVQVLLYKYYGTNYDHARQLLLFNLPPWVIPLLGASDREDAFAMNKRLKK
jgi:hypothetical protein